MNFGSILKAALGIGAAPFTGGASLIPLGISAAGQIAGGIEGGRAKGREAEIAVQQRQDEIRQQAARDALLAPGHRGHNAVQGDVMANARPASVSGPIVGTHGVIPTVTGGLSPGMFSDSTRQLGGQMSRDALLSQMQGDSFQPTPMPQSNGFDTALQIGGAAGLIGGTAGALFPPRRPQQPPAQSGLIDPTRPRSFV